MDPAIYRSGQPLKKHFVGVGMSSGVPYLVCNEDMSHHNQLFFKVSAQIKIEDGRCYSKVSYKEHVPALVRSLTPKEKAGGNLSGCWITNLLAEVWCLIWQSPPLLVLCWLIWANVAAQIKNWTTNPIQRSHNRNIFLFWCGFRH